MTTNFKKAKIRQKQFSRLAIFLPAKWFSKKPNSINVAEKRPNWQPWWVCEDTHSLFLSVGSTLFVPAVALVTTTGQPKVNPTSTELIRSCAINVATSLCKYERSLVCDFCTLLFLYQTHLLYIVKVKNVKVKNVKLKFKNVKV